MNEVKQVAKWRHFRDAAGFEFRS